MADRARAVRAFAAQLAQRYDQRFDAAYDSGPKWRLDWTDGPSAQTVRPLVAAAEIGRAHV